MSVDASVSTTGFVSVCNTVAPTMAIFVFSASIPTIRQISKDKTVGSLPLLPYSSMIANCYLWLTYGLLKSEIKIWVPNGIGLFLAIYYFIEFTKYAPLRAASLPGSVRTHQQFVVSLITCVSILAVTTKEKADFLGNIAVFFCICMFASPLAALNVVIKTKNAQSLPLPFTIATICNCFAWTVVGIFDMNDINIYLPNMLGLSCGVTQLLLKIIYCNGVEPAPSTLPL